MPPWRRSIGEKRSGMEGDGVALTHLSLFSGIGGLDLAAEMAGFRSVGQLMKLKEAGVITEEERRSMSQGNGGQLNPDWVEWLMAFPPGWTDIG